MRVKIIENEMPVFEEQVNEFLEQDIEILDMQYSTSSLAPDEECGWPTANMHSVMIRYRVIRHQYI